MQIFSWILLLIVLYIIVTSKTNKQRFVRVLIVNILLATHFESGYFISVNGLELDYGQVASLFTVVLGLVANKYQLDKKLTKAGIGFCGALLLGIVSLIVYPYGEKIVTGDANNYDEVLAGTTEMQFAKPDMGTISGLIFFGIFTFIIICAYKCLTEEDIKSIVIKLSKYYKLFFLFGIIEILFVYIIRSNIHRIIINAIMGRGRSTFSELINRGGGYMLQGFTREASHYMSALFVSIIVIIVSSVITNKKAGMWVMIYCIISTLSFSLSAVIYMIGVLCFYCLVILRKSPSGSRKTELKIFLLLTFSLIITVFCVFVVEITGKSSNNYLTQRLYEAIESVSRIMNGGKIDFANSSMIRLYSVFETFKLFLHRPIFGFGIGTLTCHGSTMMFLGDVGIAGLMLWYHFVTIIKSIYRFDKKGKILYSCSIILYIFINLLSSIYLVPYQSTYILSYIFASYIVLSHDRNLIKKVKSLSNKKGIENL